jgi:uncharacterized integral membrane protein
VKTLRTIIWVLAGIGFVVFAAYNWNRVELKLWQNFVLETPLPAIVLLVFALGFLPMWAVHRSVTWSLQRRVRALENSLKNTAMAHRSDPVTIAPAASDKPGDKSGKSGGEAGGPFDISDAGDGAGDGGSAGE